MMRWYFCAVLPLSTILLLCAGCGGGYDQLPTTKVNGNISYQGTALESGSVTFFPVDGGKHAVGMITKDGAFTLSTYESGDGAVIGKHKVVINVSYEGPDGVPNSVPRIPKKYFDLKTTPLTVNVTENDNSILLKLE